MRILFILAVNLMTVLAYGQKAGIKREQHQLDTVTVFHDMYKGALMVGGKKAMVTLQLDHKQYCDYGTFIYSEAVASGPLLNTGDWTVLKGDAKDENATVVELDASDRIMNLLRRKDGKLQQLDSTLNVIKPIADNLLTPENKK